MWAGHERGVTSRFIYSLNFYLASGVGEKWEGRAEGILVYISVYDFFHSTGGCILPPVPAVGRIPAAEAAAGGGGPDGPGHRVQHAHRHQVDGVGLN